MNMPTQQLTLLAAAPGALGPGTAETYSMTQIQDLSSDFHTDLIKTTEVLRILGSVIQLSRTSLQTMHDKGILRRWSKTAGGQYLYRRSDVLTYRNQLLSKPMVATNTAAVSVDEDSEHV
jgi:hypothetical protein